MQIEHIEIKRLTLLEKNPRKITKEQFEKLCKSLTDDPDFFLCRPCLVNYTTEDKKMTVYAGNQRVRAGKKLKWKTVPCMVEEDICEETMSERTIKDNKTYGEFDLDMLANEWDVTLLLDAGFTEAELSVDLDVLADSESSESNEEKKDKEQTCPSCGHRFI